MKTPDLTAHHIVNFCAGFSTQTPFYVHVKPQPDMQLGDCFNNLDLVLLRCGGEAIMGWTLYEWPGVFLEAEYHYTWRTRSGDYEDPTPRGDGKSKIAFLPDSTVGPHTFPENRRKVLIQDSAVQEYFAVIDKIKTDGPSLMLCAQMLKLKRPLEKKYGKEG